MAIDFPNTPTTGQTFTVGTITWTYDGSKWKSNGVANGARFAVSDTAPTTPQTGDGWFNSSDSQLYIYYDSFWVAASQNLKGDAGTSGVFSVTSPIKNTGTSTNAVLGLDYSALQYGRNYIINGGFDFWQRGTSFSSAGYTADRWYTAAGNATVSKQTAAPPLGTQAYTRITATNTSAAANHYCYLESSQTAPLLGKTVTLSINLRRNSTMTANIAYRIDKSSTIDAGSGATWTNINSAIAAATSISSGTSTSDWTTFTLTVFIPNDGTANSLRLLIFEATYMSTGMYWELGGVQLEVGSTATPFSRAGGTIAGERASCERYFYRWLPTQNSIASMFIAGTNSASEVWTNINLPTTMRTSPSFSTNISGASNATNPTGTLVGFYNGGFKSFTGSLTTSLFGANFNQALIRYYGSWSGITSGITGTLDFGSSCYMDFSAEL